MLDGAARIPDVVAKAAADGQPAIGITDHGNMYGVLDFYPRPPRRRSRRGRRDGGLHGHDQPLRAHVAADHDIFHLTLLAESNAGYRNLIKVSIDAYLDGFFYSPGSTSICSRAP